MQLAISGTGDQVFTGRLAPREPPWASWLGEGRRPSYCGWGGVSASRVLTLPEPGVLGGGSAEAVFSVRPRFLWALLLLSCFSCLLRCPSGSHRGTLHPQWPLDPLEVSTHHICPPCGRRSSVILQWEHLSRNKPGWILGFRPFALIASGCHSENTGNYPRVVLQLVARMVHH